MTDDEIRAALRPSLAVLQADDDMMGTDNAVVLMNTTAHLAAELAAVRAERDAMKERDAAYTALWNQATDWLAERDRARAQLAAIRELHCEIVQGQDTGFCGGCDMTWPCSSIAAVGGVDAAPPEPQAVDKRVLHAEIGDGICGFCIAGVHRFYGSSDGRCTCCGAAGAVLQEPATKDGQR